MVHYSDEQTSPVDQRQDALFALLALGGFWVLLGVVGYLYFVAA